MSWDGDSQVGNGPRGGRMECECSNPTHPRSCTRPGSMKDGRFLCRYCFGHDTAAGMTETPADYEKRTHRKWEDRA
jgi:hypothetical protein